MLKNVNRFMRGLAEYLGQWVRFLGRILVAIGLVLMGTRGEYQVVRRIIETTLRSVLIRMEVVQVTQNHALYTTFVTRVRTSFANRLDWSYFHLELMLQLGCGFEDISHSLVATNKDFSTYNIDITKTALNNLEMGRTERLPDLFEERDTEYRLTRALELAKTTELTPELLEKELGITSYHANLLFRQLTQSEALPKRPEGKLMN